MARWDNNTDGPDSRKLWQVGDEVWVDHTLYVIESMDEGKVYLKRHDPIKIRRVPDRDGR